MPHINSLGPMLFSLLVPFLGMAPDTGLCMVHSRWTPKVVGVAMGTAIAGFLCWALGLLEEARLIIGFIAPLFQLAFLRVAYSLFKRNVGRWPINVIFNWKRGLAWDRFFFFSVTMVGIVTPVFLIKPS